MHKLIDNIKKFEKRNNVSAMVVVYSDGSNEVKEFWDSENFASFDNTEKLHQYLERATYKMSENGRMISPSKLVCSVCKSEKPCSGINNIEPCFLIDEERKFLAESKVLSISDVMAMLPDDNDISEIMMRDTMVSSTKKVDGAKWMKSYLKRQVSAD